MYNIVYETETAWRNICVHQYWKPRIFTNRSGRRSVLCAPAVGFDASAHLRGIRSAYKVRFSGNWIQKISLLGLFTGLKINSLGFPYKALWSFKVPAKVSVFLWLAVRNSILTKDVLHRRGWMGDWMCQFCGANETITHLFFQCPLARYIWNVACCVFGFKNYPTSVQHLLGGWIKGFRKKDKCLIKVGVAAVMWALWKTRNNSCFRNMRPHDPVAVTNMIGNLVSSWAILQGKEGNRDAINWGAKLFMRLSREAFNATQGWRPATMRIMGWRCWRLFDGWVSWFDGAFLEVQWRRSWKIKNL